MAVRKESVRLTLDGNDFTTGMARAAAETAMLNRELERLDKAGAKAGKGTDQAAKGTAKLGGESDKATGILAGLNAEMDSLSKHSVQTSRVAMPKVGAAAREMSGDLKRAEKQIDSMSGRLGLLAEAAILLGPSLIPLGAIAAPAVAGLASGLGATVLGAISVAAAFQGVGDALKAVNAAALEPSVENLAKAREAMAGLSPAAQDAVTRMSELGPTLKGIRDAAAGGFFPGFTESMTLLENRGPELERIVASLGGVMGDLLSDGATALSGSEWDDFFDFLATDAADSLRDMGEAIGNLSAGLAELWMSVDPLSDMGTGWLKDATASFAEWAAGVDETDGFREFVEYIRETGPQLGDTLSALGDAFLQIIEATAPLGGPVLAVLEGFAKAIASIADSDLGTPIMTGVAALTLLNRTLAITAKLGGGAAGGAAAGGLFGGLTAARSGITGFTSDLKTLRNEVVATGRATERVAKASERMGSLKAGLLKTTAGVAGLTVATSGLADGFGLANTAAMGLMGAAFGPWGAGIGAAAGFAIDLAGGFGQAAKEAKAAEEAALAAKQAAEGFAASLEADGSVGVRAATDLYDRFSGAEKGIAAAGGSLEAFVAQVHAGESASAAFAEQIGMSVADVEKIASGDYNFWDLIDQYGEGAITAFEYAAQVSGVDTALDAVKGNSDAGARATEQFGDAQEAAAASAEKNAKAQWDAANATLAARGAARDYESALDAAREAAAKNGRTLDITTEAGHANQAALDQLATSWNGMRQTTKGTSANFEKARGDFVATAVAMGMASGKAERLANKMLDIPTDVQVELKAQGIDPATASARQLKAAMDAIKSKTVYLKWITTTSAGAQVNAKRNDPGLTNSADGGTVGRAAWGTTVPTSGLPYADRYPYLLADGEEVITNRRGEADRRRPLLKAVNDGADTATLMGIISQEMVRGRLADGGTAGLAKGGTSKGKTSAAVGMLAAPQASLPPLQIALGVMTKAAEASAAALEAETSKRNSLASAMESLHKSELFGKKQSPFLDTSKGPLEQLKQDNADIQARMALQKKAASQGITGDAFAELVSKTSLPELSGLLSSKGFGAQYQQLYDQRASGSKALGEAAGVAAYGKTIAELQKTATRDAAHQKRLEGQQKRLENRMAEMKKAIEKSAKSTGREVAKGTSGSSNRGRSNVRK